MTSLSLPIIYQKHLRKNLGYSPLETKFGPNFCFQLVPVCPTGSGAVALTAASSDFTVKPKGPSFGSTVDVNDALSGSGQSISITSFDKIIVQPLCPDVSVLSATVTVDGATRLIIQYQDTAGTLIDKFRVTKLHGEAVFLIGNQPLSKLCSNSSA